MELLWRYYAVIMGYYEYNKIIMNYYALLWHCYGFIMTLSRRYYALLWRYYVLLCRSPL